MDLFSEKVLIVTGASEGIGRALCLALAPQRPKLVLAARNEARLEELAERCRNVGAETLVLPTDVTQQEACQKLIEGTVEKFGQIDVLVNNAGGTMWELFENVTDLSIFEHVMRLNYLGSVYCTHFALPHLKKTKGLIVPMASIAGLTGVPTRTGYAASKHAIFGFFDSLRIELAGTGVDVSIMAPDFVVSEIHKRALKGDGSPLVDTPINESEVMTAEECAEMIIYGMEERKRVVIMSTRGKLGRWLKLIAPKVIDNIARRAIESGK